MIIPFKLTGFHGSSPAYSDLERVQRANACLLADVPVSERLIASTYSEDPHERTRQRERALAEMIEGLVEVAKPAREDTRSRQT